MCTVINCMVNMKNIAIGNLACISVANRIEKEECSMLLSFCYFLMR